MSFSRSSVSPCEPEHLSQDVVEHYADKVPERWSWGHPLVVSVLITVGIVIATVVGLKA